jgi:cell division protein FtsL
MIRATVAWLALVVLAGTGLFLVKHEVQDLEERLARLDDRIAKEHEAVHVLRAEWAYLTRPERLARLAERHLELKPPSPGQIANSIDSLPPPADTTPTPDDGATRPTLATMKPPSE